MCGRPARWVIYEPGSDCGGVSCDEHLSAMLTEDTVQIDRLKEGKEVQCDLVGDSVLAAICSQLLFAEYKCKTGLLRHSPAFIRLCGLAGIKLEEEE